MSRVVVSILLMGLLGAAFALPAQAQGEALICLDAGHGGTDPGAVFRFPDGRLLKESDINLDVALAVKALLERDGHKVTLTRSDDRYMTTRQRYPLANYTEATMIVSIHTNSIAAERANEVDGSCALTMKDGDYPLASSMASTLYAMLLPNAPDASIFLDRGVLRFRSRILSRVEMPSVIVEPVFLSHPSEAARLVAAIQRDGNGNVLPNTRRGEIAHAIYKGIVSYLDWERAQRAQSDAPSSIIQGLGTMDLGSEYER